MPTVSPLVHIGYHKTGTNWLQRHVFRSRELGFVVCGSERKVKRQLVLPHDFDFDPHRCRERFLRCFERAGAAGLVPVLSAERLCGDLAFGAYDSARLADRVVSTFPESKVLIVVREQRAMLFSSYQQYVRMGGLLRLDRYLNRPSSHRWPHPWPCDLQHFEYDRLIARYHDGLGSANVLVLPYELFRRDAAEFVRRIVRFAGGTAALGAHLRVPAAAVANPSWPPATLGLKRGLNSLVRERINPWAPIDRDGALGRASGRLLSGIGALVPAGVQLRIEGRMREKIAAAVDTRYRPSNARTEVLTGLDLRDYGYDVADSPDVRAGPALPPHAVAGTSTAEAKGPAEALPRGY